MLEAPMPENEVERLCALQQTHLLDSPIEERFERITRLVCRLLQVPVAMITLVDGKRQWFKSAQGTEVTETPREIAFCGHTILSDQVFMVTDARKDARFADSPLVTGPEEVVFYAGHPLKGSDGSRVGALCAVDHKPREFSEDDLQTLRDLAALAELEIGVTSMGHSHKELLGQVDAAGLRNLTDPMTRIWNSEGIMELLKRDHGRALVTRQRLAVMMVDVDHLKLINDTHGQAVGDEVLRQVAKRLLGSVREYDAVGRIGGEEFLIVMPLKPDSAKVETIAARVCDRMEEMALLTSVGRLKVTISVGAVDEAVECRSTIDELLRSAEEALHLAKHGGRNRSEVVLTSMEQLTTPVVYGVRGKMKMALDL